MVDDGELALLHIAGEHLVEQPHAIPLRSLVAHVQLMWGSRSSPFAVRAIGELRGTTGPGDRQPTAPTGQFFFAAAQQNLRALVIRSRICLRPKRKSHAAPNASYCQDPPSSAPFGVRRPGGRQAVGPSGGDGQSRQSSGRCYVPPGLSGPAPLVVVLHGCTQNAAVYDHGSGWSRLADRHGFLLLFPEQQRANNPMLCFNWFSGNDSQRGMGEAASIAKR